MEPRIGQSDTNGVVSSIDTHNGDGPPQGRSEENETNGCVANNKTEEFEDDLLLAWEILEIGRKTFENRFAIDEANGKKRSLDDLSDYAFILVRLSDIMVMNREFTAAAEELERVIVLRAEAVLTKKIYAVYVALAQAYYYNSNYVAALKNYEDAASRIRLVISMAGNESEKDLSTSLEEIELNIMEIEALLKKEQECGNNKEVPVGISSGLKDVNK
eukprot:TRINITY_DN126791_c0_g1_i2.p1 TRINITY_DN126791_c0_g1~~TRINITY_DN126791_c0_g1_i2.p1  ORF type:complete len:217 (-),score=29.41 TRINITY_DN126791_c0_g1_i2:47-697(-)